MLLAQYYFTSARFCKSTMSLLFLLRLRLKSELGTLDACMAHLTNSRQMSRPCAKLPCQKVVFSGSRSTFAKLRCSFRSDAAGRCEDSMIETNTKQICLTLKHPCLRTKSLRRILPTSSHQYKVPGRQHEACRICIQRMELVWFTLPVHFLPRVNIVPVRLYHASQS